MRADVADRSGYSINRSDISKVLNSEFHRGCVTAPAESVQGLLNISGPRCGRQPMASADGGNCAPSSVLSRDICVELSSEELSASRSSTDQRWARSQTTL
jgi:hypothetical protein